MIIWLPAIGLLVFGIFGLAGGEIRLTRRKTLRGQQAKVVGGLCLAGAAIISPVGIMTMALLIDDSGRSPGRTATAARRTSDSPSSSNFVPPPPPPPASPAPPTRSRTDSPSYSNFPPPASPPPASPTHRQTNSSTSSSYTPPASATVSAPPPRQRVVIFDVLGYDGQAEPSEAARAALQHISWAVATDVEADLDAQQVMIPVRSPRLSTVSARAALEQVGFQVGGVKLTWREIP